MIDQRVSEGILSNFFNEKALTTTIPAQLIKKFNIAVVPIYIERIEGIKFRIKVNNPIIVKNIKLINKNFLRIDKFLRRLFSIS